MLEPGRALVARCAALHVSVIARLQRRGVEWLFLDAGAYSALFEALACQGKTQYRVRTGAPAAGDLRSFALAGPTGDGLDVIAHAVLLPERIAIGDELVIEDVGAYSMTMASDFNGFAVPPLRQRRPALSRTISGD
jgi:ornithine decarboxylase